MAFDRFLIAPFNSGLQTDLRPFLIPEDAFSQLNNAYVFRGRLRKRFGSTYMGVDQTTSRLRINIGTDSGNFTGTATGPTWKAGQAISISGFFYTVISNTTGPQPMLRDDGQLSVATFDVSNGAVSIPNSPAGGASVWFYPALPVMGLTNFEQGPINDQPSYAFDTQFAYVYAGSGWTRSVAGTPPLFTGSDSQFFWTANWRGVTTANANTVLFVTNFNQPDAIWYYSTPVGWTQATGSNAFYTNPNGGAPQTGAFVVTCRLIAAFKNRLLLFDTYESDGAMSPTVSQYKSRVRYCHNGSPFAQNAWYEPNAMDNSGTPQLSVGDGGSFLDATTEEEITSLEFIKDRLIVYFERSTWELAYTGNYVQPFVWQKINTELGSEAPFSTVPFDKEILTIGNTGVHSCNGSNVARIDNKIPDQIFQIENKAEGVARVAGIRDYFTELVYWTFPSIESQPLFKYPNQVLVYNYKNGSWAFNDDCITAWGYFEQSTGLTWESAGSLTWEQANFSWNSGITQAQFRQVLAGNQQGFTFVVNADVSTNAAVMQLTNISYDPTSDTCTITCLDHTVSVGQYVKLVNVNGVTMSGFGIYQVVSIDPMSPDLFTIGPITIFSGSYTGGGTIARASNINIVSKQWNPYLNRGQSFYLAKIDFGVQSTELGQVTVDYYPSDSEVSMLQGGIDTQSIQGTGVLETSPYDPAFYPLEQQQDRLWHPVYFQAEAECIQINIYMADDQMVVPGISESDFQIDGMVLHTMRVGTRLE